MTQGEVVQKVGLPLLRGEGEAVIGGGACKGKTGQRERRRGCNLDVK